MTTEDDFQRQLDANPEDWQTRLVFADWLQERDDPRAEGYRALGFLRNRPEENKKELFWVYSRAGSGASILWPRCDLPEDWFELIYATKPELDPSRAWCGYVKTRREAEDAAALAFAKLSADRRAELLAGIQEIVK